jgi:hypothetical protein
MFEDSARKLFAQLTKEKVFVLAHKNDADSLVCACNQDATQRRIGNLIGNPDSIAASPVNRRGYSQALSRFRVEGSTRSVAHFIAGATYRLACSKVLFETRDATQRSAGLAPGSKANPRPVHR